MQCCAGACLQADHTAHHRSSLPIIPTLSLCAGCSAILHPWRGSLCSWAMRWQGRCTCWKPWETLEDGTMLPDRCFPPKFCSWQMHFADRRDIQLMAGTFCCVRSAVCMYIMQCLRTFCCVQGRSAVCRDVLLCAGTFCCVQGRSALMTIFIPYAPGAAMGVPLRKAVVYSLSPCETVRG